MWFQVTLKEGGMKPLRQKAFVEGDSKEDAEERARKYLGENLFGIESVSLTEVGEDDETIFNRVKMSFHPNLALTKHGEKLRPSDLD